jgi:hypothetical protein
VGDDEKVRRGSCGAEKMDQVVDLLTLSDFSVFGEFHFKVIEMRKIRIIGHLQ